MMKRIVTVFALFVMTFVISGYQKPDVYKIDAVQNAVIHNNLGLNAVCDKNYYDAVQEFILAIALNPRTQATAVYYNNLGEVYMKIGYYKDAQTCFENSIKQYSLNFLYYQNLVKSYKSQGLTRTKLKVYKVKSQKEPMAMIILGLLYIANGETSSGIIKLDEFCMQEPDLIITPAVRNYMRSVKK